MRGSGNYDWKKKIQSSVCWVRGSGDYDRKKKPVVCLAGCAVALFFVVAGNFDYDRKKKDTVVCWREIGSFFVVAGNFHYDRGKKKIHYDRKKKEDTVVCLMGARFWRLRLEKKKIQSSVWRVVLLYQFLVLAGNTHFFFSGVKF